MLTYKHTHDVLAIRLIKKSINFIIFKTDNFIIIKQTINGNAVGFIGPGFRIIISKFKGQTVKRRDGIKHSYVLHVDIDSTCISHEHPFSVFNFDISLSLLLFNGNLLCSHFTHIHLHATKLLTFCLGFFLFWS